MKALTIVLSFIGLTVMGCSGANLTSNLRQSRLEGAEAQTRCEPCDMRNAGELKTLFEKYDGWHVLYISEYTTGHLTGTSGVVCFERVRK